MQPGDEVSGGVEGLTEFTFTVGPAGAEVRR
jgi:hypothetical protein